LELDSFTALTSAVGLIVAPRGVVPNCGAEGFLAVGGFEEHGSRLSEEVLGGDRNGSPSNCFLSVNSGVAVALAGWGRGGLERRIWTGFRAAEGGRTEGLVDGTWKPIAL
jgi:hypothetical protein